MIHFLLNFYILIIIADVILSFLPQFRHYQVVQFVRKAADLSLAPIRKFLRNILPHDIPFDISPLIVIILLQLIMALW
ncbi:MAG: YggT family protein [Oligoflexia bacterium]|nr:YggT family protein [Oligoflexia bacterium]MBF0366667.1 YggT family protein [Oligoflexia bacterium]